jgi:hypothetical protein
MTLVPCKVCGTLNSSEAEICLSCEYPITGRRRPAIFQGAAIALALTLTIPLLLGVMQLIRQQFHPQPPARPSPASTQGLTQSWHSLGPHTSG